MNETAPTAKPKTEPAAAQRATKRNKKSGESWRTWLPRGAAVPPPEELVTRDDILANINQRWPGTINEREFRYLQSNGVVPRPTFRRVGTATVGMYPAWVAQTVYSALRLRAEGMSWDYIRDRIRADPTAIHRTGASSPPEPEPAYTALTEAVEDFAKWVERVTGKGAAGAEVRLLDEQGHRIAYIRLAEDGDAPSRFGVAEAKPNPRLAIQPIQGTDLEP